MSTKWLVYRFGRDERNQDCSEEPVTIVEAKSEFEAEWVEPLEFRQGKYTCPNGWLAKDPKVICYPGQSVGAVRLDKAPSIDVQWLNTVNFVPSRLFPHIKEDANKLFSGRKLFNHGFITKTGAYKPVLLATCDSLGIKHNGRLDGANGVFVFGQMVRERGRQSCFTYAVGAAMSLISCRDIEDALDQLTVFPSPVVVLIDYHDVFYQVTDRCRCPVPQKPPLTGMGWVDLGCMGKRMVRMHVNGQVCEEERERFAREGIICPETGEF